jgi:hypothetical protein
VEQQAQNQTPQFSVDIVATGILITIPEGVQIMAGDVRNVLESVRDIMVTYATLQIEEKALEAADAAEAAAHADAIARNPSAE